MNGGGAALVGGPVLLDAAVLRPNDGAEAELVEVVITRCAERVGAGEGARVGVLARVGALGRDEAYALEHLMLGDLPRPVLRPAPSLDKRVSATGAPPAWMYW